MSDQAHAMAVALFVQSFECQEEKETTVKIVSRGKVGGKKQAKSDFNRAEGFEAAPLNPANKGPNEKAIKAFDTTRSLDAKGFLLAWRKAKTQEEKEIAIDSYVGYDTTQTFGSQYNSAMAQANRELNPALAAPKEYKRSATISAQGYIAGMPDAISRHILNLQAKEREAIDTLIASPSEENKCTLAMIRAAIKASLPSE